jgi:hypothetical protein
LAALSSDNKSTGDNGSQFTLSARRKRVLDRGCDRRVDRNDAELADTLDAERAQRGRAASRLSDDCANDRHDTNFGTVRQAAKAAMPSGADEPGFHARAA